MFKHYLKVAYRNIVKYKGCSFINVGGLAIGIACCILIMLWAQHETTVDRFHSNKDVLYAVASQVRYGDEVHTALGTPPALGPALGSEYPEIERASRRIQIGPKTLRYGDRAFQEPLYAVDPSFLAMFSFPLVQGDANSVLTEPHSIVMTESIARKYFNEEDPVGKLVVIEGKYTFTVTGIIADVPANSTFRFNLLIPCAALEELWNDTGYLTGWTNYNVQTYVQLQPEADFRSVSRKIADRINRGDESADTTLFLRRFADLYLYWLGLGGGRMGQVILFSLIALFVLLIACVNFMNLATARSTSRAREIGLRKVAGAHQRSIMLQFYGESFLLAFISLIVAVALVEVFLPAFNDLSGRQLSLDFAANPGMVIGLIAVTVVTGLVAGSYPALFMSSFAPVRIFSSMPGTGRKKVGFRRGLVVMQFVVSITLIIITMTVSKQLNFVSQVDLGFDRSNLVYIPLKGVLVDRSLELKQEVLQYPGIEQASITSGVPTGVWHNGAGWDWKGRTPDTDPLVTYFCTDADFRETFRTEIIQGRFYGKGREDVSSGTTGEIVINERFAEIIGADDPVGIRLSAYGNDYEVIGVMKDFHFKPLHYRVGPLIVFRGRISPTGNDHRNYLFARFHPDHVAQVTGHLESACANIDPDFPVVLRFLEDDYTVLYGSVDRFQRIITWAAGLMILIASMGLIGLAAFTAEQRSKEISIRKVLGATHSSIVQLLCKEILKPVAIANVIAWALSYLFASGWLMARFAYQTSIGWAPFAIATIMAMTIAVLSVSFQALKAARANPADTLRHE